jgi:release factor glutamine methyltransferase
MTIQKALNKAVEKLRLNNIDNSLFEANTILCQVLKADKLYLAVNKDKNLSEKIVEKFNSLIDKRIQGIPLQYVTGYQEFMSLGFKVNKNVLIPRQDTETLVEYVINETKKSKEIIKILDLCTGSGCIAVSLAYYINDSDITAIDISKEAIKVATENAIINKVEKKIKFICENIFEYGSETGEYDFLVSNPPYIPSNDINRLESTVKDYEPFSALDGGEKGLDFYPKIIEIAEKALRFNGTLVLEVGHDQSFDIMDMIEKRKAFTDIKTIKDLCNINRIVCAKKNSTD